MVEVLITPCCVNYRYLPLPPPTTLHRPHCASPVPTKWTASLLPPSLPLFCSHPSFSVGAVETIFPVVAAIFPKLSLHSNNAEISLHTERWRLPLSTHSVLGTKAGWDALLLGFRTERHVIIPMTSFKTFLHFDLALPPHLSWSQSVGQYIDVSVAYLVFDDHD